MKGKEGTVDERVDGSRQGQVTDDEFCIREPSKLFRSMR